MPPTKERGSYKQYNFKNNDSKIPRQTRFNQLRKNAELNQTVPLGQNEVDMEVVDNSETEPYNNVPGSNFPVSDAVAGPSGVTALQSNSSSDDDSDAVAGPSGVTALQISNSSSDDVSDAVAGPSGVTALQSNSSSDDGSEDNIDYAGYRSMQDDDYARRVYEYESSEDNITEDESDASRDNRNVNEDENNSETNSSDDDDEPDRNVPTILDLLNNPQLEQNLFPESNITVLQAIVMISSFATRSGITNDNLQVLLDIFILLLPRDSRLPKTLYFFTKLLPVEKTQLKFYCPKCNVTFPRSECGFSFICSCSKTVYPVTQLVAQNSYMFILSIKKQLKSLLEDFDLGKCLRNHHKQSNGLCDISDGSMYRQFANGKLISNQSALSLLVTTDGVPVFNSSNVAMWPVSLMLNELPPKLRKQYLMVCALWIGTGKPSCKLLFENLVDEIKTLSRTGFRWTLLGEVVTSTVDVIAVVADSIARAPIQNFLQFNGFFGCSWCEHPGETYNNTHVYKFDPSCILRTGEKVNQCAYRAGILGYPVMGVRGFSDLKDLPGFNVVDCIVYDPMHGVDLGVTRQLGGLWFSPSNSKMAWYIGNAISILNEKLKAIIPPSNITRLARGFQERPHWKASEWRNLLLFYGPFIFKDVMKKRYYDHFMLLSESMYILNKKKISPLELYEARTKLRLFVERFEILYGLGSMTFNVHQLLHVCDCVSLWGPLWGYSAYGFEDLYGKLMRMYNGTQKVGDQIVKRFKHLQNLKALTTVLADENHQDFVDIQRRLLGNFVPAKKLCRFEDAIYVGAGKPHILSIVERNLLGQRRSFSNVLRFSKLLFNNNIFTVSSYKVASRRQDCFVMTSDNTLYELTDFYSIELTRRHSPSQVVFGIQINYTPMLASYAKNQIIRAEEKLNLCLISIVDIEFKCVVLKMDPLFLSVLPNMLDRD